MTESFLHGVNVIEVTSGTRTIRTAKSSVIGLIGIVDYVKIQEVLRSFFPSQKT